MTLRLLGQIRMQQGDHDQAEKAFLESLATFQDLQSEYEAAKTKLSLIRLAHETETPVDQETLAETVATFKRLGARADLARARELNSTQSAANE